MVVPSTYIKRGHHFSQYILKFQIMRWKFWKYCAYPNGKYMAAKGVKILVKKSAHCTSHKSLTSGHRGDFQQIELTMVESRRDINVTTSCSNATKGAIKSRKLWDFLGKNTFGGVTVMVKKKNECPIQFWYIIFLAFQIIMKWVTMSMGNNHLKWFKIASTWYLWTFPW